MEIEELNVEAKIGNLSRVTQYVEKIIKRHGCEELFWNQIELAVEEIFVNIASYAYPSGAGIVNISCTVCGGVVCGDAVCGGVVCGDAACSGPICGRPAYAVIRFCDRGIPYNPLEVPPPDLKCSPGERRAGGLGIFLVKHYMDEMVYEFREGKNIVTLKKWFSQSSGEGKRPVRYGLPG